MTQIQSAEQQTAIQSFLRVSRQYFAHPSAALRPAKAGAWRKLVQSVLLSAGAGFFVAGPVLAHDHDCDHGMGGSMGGQMGAHAERHAKMMDEHHARLHEALKLNAEQEPAWKKLIDSEAPKPPAGAAMGDWSKLTAPERAEKMLEMSKARQARMAEHVSALKAFYAVLTPAQQKTFEEFHAGQHGKERAAKDAKEAPAAAGKSPVKP